MEATASPYENGARMGRQLPARVGMLFPTALMERAATSGVAEDVVYVGRGRVAWRARVDH